MTTTTMKDWQDREYQVEIAFVRFAPNYSGYVVYVDDELYREGEMFTTKEAAPRAIADHFAGSGCHDPLRP